MATKKKKQLIGSKMGTYRRGLKPQRLNTGVPESVLNMLASMFDLGHHGSGKKSALVTLGLKLVLYCAGHKGITAADVAQAIGDVFPGAAQAWASNFMQLAEALGDGVAPHGEVEQPAQTETTVLRVVADVEVSGAK